jgi:lysine 2,3-aminomutase
MWKQHLAQSYSNVNELAQAGLITSAEASRLADLGERFKVRITPYYASLMKPQRDCPIRLQAIPDLGEEDPALPEWAATWSQKIYGRAAPWHADAIGDVAKLAVPRLTHRYGNRAILHLSSLCAVYCRFCFRKGHLNDDERTLYEGNLDPAFDYLARTPEIRELILTGGDPLSLTDSAFARVLERVGQIPHIRVLRIHSRMAVTLPSRLTAELAQVMGRPRDFSIHLVSHFNHPREWTADARAGLARISEARVQLFNQNVLLAGINDSVECLTELYQGLYEAGVMPFYLHHPDWTPGTFQFRLSVERGQEIARGLRGLLPGPAIPHYVLDIPQGYGKALLLDGTVKRIDQLREGAIQGDVYELQAPRTRTQQPSPLYLDLYPRLCSTLS